MGTMVEECVHGATTVSDELPGQSPLAADQNLT
jgi:hypothetical protein